MISPGCLANIGSLRAGILALACTLGIPAAGQAASAVTTLYSFTGQDGDGASPYGGVVLGSGGALYGATALGGTFGAGTVFELTSNSPGGWTETVLYSFTGGSDGGFPQGSLTFGPDGVLYGATLYGGAAAMGAIFELKPPRSPGGAWAETAIYSFSGADGAFPYNGPMVTSNGTLYGTTELGGQSGYGTVYRLAPQRTGSPWVQTVLYSFTGAGDGAFPYAGLAIDANGNLYGTTEYGGAEQKGTVFELARPKSGGAWTETVLHAFQGTDGGFPNAGVIMSATGILYGATPGGVGAGNGSVYQLTPPSGGDTWKETVLASFTSGADGGSPHAPLVLAQGGAILGTDLNGGSGTRWAGNGLVFELEPPTSGGGWTENVLYTFQGANDGGDPDAPLISGANGVFYGTTLRGGTAGQGTVFSITP